MNRQLIREARHQALVAQCEAYRERRPYSPHDPEGARGTVMKEST